MQKIQKNTGPLWGLYLENVSTYSKANATVEGLSTCCTKILDHVGYYAVEHITRPVGDSYVIALYNTHAHTVETSILDLTILYGHLGEVTQIQTPPSSGDSLISFIILTVITGIGASTIGLVAYTLLIKPRRRQKF